MNTNTLAYRPSTGEVRKWIALALDMGERCLLLGFYAWFAYRIINNYLEQEQGCIPNLLYLVSEGLVIFLILIRRTTRVVSLRIGDWILAFAGTTLPLLVYPCTNHPLISPAIATIIIFLGMLIQISAKIVLGRSWGCVPANRGIKLVGPYRFVRHPMYAGYLLVHIGFFFTNLTSWNLGIFILCYYVQISRILAEERLLSDDPDYSEYMSSVKYRLVPWFF